VTSNNNNDNKVDNNHILTDASSFISEKSQQAIITVVRGEQKLSPFAKRILIIDDDPDTTLTFKQGLETENKNDNKIFFKVYTYNDPLVALSEFKPNFYDLLVIDINMPKMNGFELSTKILEIDINPRICFMSSGQINQEALRELYPTLSIGCFIRKPITIDELVRRVKAELD
jgi:DNA-binding response OmpR family regulator